MGGGDWHKLNNLYTNEEYAKQSPWGSLLAPSGMVHVFALGTMKAAIDQFVHGKCEFPDDPNVKLNTVVEEEGVLVSQAASGEAALALFDEPATPEIHLVVTDMRMPGMSGLDLLTALRQRTRAPKVVMITAHGNERLAVEATKAGAYDYFRKPFELEELVAVVSNQILATTVEGLREKFRGLVAGDPTEMLVARVEANAVNPDAGVSGLGFLTMMADYGATLGWYFGAVEDNPQNVLLKTMARLQMRNQ